MAEILLIPPVAFLIYLGLVGIVSAMGRILAGTKHSSSDLKTSTYASGEAPPAATGAPGYRPFFLVALFFAILHLGVLVLASGGTTSAAVVYLLGLMLALIVLILG
jgi:NADH:ubiquinone oxidoreductase subunit 3 (subunit A)